jgi:hypothetical protein
MGALDTGMKLIGLNPTEYSTRTEASMSERNIEGYFKGWHDRIYESYRVAHINGDRTAINDAMRSIGKYNQAIRDRGAQDLVTPIKLSNLVKAARTTPTKQERKEARYKGAYVG